MGYKVKVGLSNKHLHLTKEHVAILFGEGHELVKTKDLVQPGQFACEEKVDIVGPKGTLKGIRVLGPERPETQVELSMTDARTIGIKAPVRESGDTAGSGACKVIGPCGEIEISEGVIVAKRHIHLTPADAEELGVKDKDVVWVKLDTDGRKAILGDVVVRVSEKFSRAMHIDTDESNAVSAPRDLEGEIIEL